MRTNAALVTVLLLGLTGTASAQTSPLASRHVVAPSGLALGERGANQALQRYAPSELAFRLRGRESFGDGDRILRFGATYRGLPVLGAGASVRLRASGAVREVFHSGAASWPGSVTPKIDRAAARASIERATGWRVSEARMALGVDLRHGEGRLAWFAYPEIPAGVPMSLRAVLDAEDGSLIEAVDRARAATAHVYPANPVSTPELQDLELPIAEAAADTLAGPLLVAKNCVDRKSVKQTPFGFGAHVCDLEDSADADASGNYRLTPLDDGSAAAAEDPYSQVSMYYHSARAYRYFQDLQGDPAAVVVGTPDIPLSTIANLRLPAGFGGEGGFDPNTIGDPDIPLEPMQNAFFSPGGQGDFIAEIMGVQGGGLYFGQGPTRDFAYDGDVVYHEFTHAVVGKTLELDAYVIDEYGTSAAPGAMNEGLADFFSSAITGEALLGEYAGGETPGGGSIRNLDNTMGCSETVGGESHNDGMFFSAALWAARAALPEADRVRYDASLYKVMRSHAGTTTPTYEELTSLFVQGLQTDLPAAAPLLTDALTSRGILPKCTRIREQVGNTPVAAPADLGLFFAPGSAYVGSARVPGVIQVHVKFPAGTTSLRVWVNGLASYQGLGGGGRFEPSVVARFGAEPLLWRPGRRATGTFDFEQSLRPDEDYEQAIDLVVPEGASEVYLQIINDGQSDGIYESLSAEVDTRSTPGADAGVSSSGGSSSGAPTYLDVNDDGGCGCHQAPNAGSGFTAVLAALGLALSRRLRLRR